jgi:hypothetical protein
LRTEYSAEYCIWIKKETILAWRRLYNNEFHNSYSSWVLTVGRACSMYRKWLWFKMMKGRHVRDPGIDGTIILR